MSARPSSHSGRNPLAFLPIRRKQPKGPALHGADEAEVARIHGQNGINAQAFGQRHYSGIAQAQVEIGVLVYQSLTSLKVFIAKRFDSISTLGHVREELK